EHTHARADNDPVRLAKVSERFERLGTIQYAAEASYAAAHAFRHLGDPGAAARASVRATGLHDNCEQAVIGAIADFHNTDLTPREEQIAMLAAAGHSDTAIAARLTISPRTVQTHLLRAYHKLSITSRHDLPTALMSNDEPSDRSDQD
ncbi:MAG: helix-turn-helix transcriptional regulator, partial [Antricoccus sp.]